MSFQSVPAEVYSRCGKQVLLWNELFLKHNVVPLKKTYRKMLDMGCGTGESTHFFEKYFNADGVVAIDQTKAYIEHARNQDPNTNNVYKVCDLSQEEGLQQIIKDHVEIDLVISSLAIQWVDDPISIFKVLLSSLTGPTEHIHMIVSSTYEAMYGILENIPRSPKWKGYLKDCQIPRCLRKEAANTLPERFRRGLSVLPYEILNDLETVMIMRCQTHEEDLEFLQFLLPFTKYIPMDMQDEFLQDCWQEVLKTTPLEDGKIPWQFGIYHIHARSL